MRHRMEAGWVAGRINQASKDSRKQAYSCKQVIVKIQRRTERWVDTVTGLSGLGCAAAGCVAEGVYSSPPVAWDPVRVYCRNVDLSRRVIVV